MFVHKGALLYHNHIHNIWGRPTLHSSPGTFPILLLSADPESPLSSCTRWPVQNSALNEWDKGGEVEERAGRWTDGLEPVPLARTSLRLRTRVILRLTICCRQESWTQDIYLRRRPITVLYTCIAGAAGSLHGVGAVMECLRRGDESRHSNSYISSSLPPQHFAVNVWGEEMNVNTCVNHSTSPSTPPFFFFFLKLKVSCYSRLWGVNAPFTQV